MPDLNHTATMLDSVEDVKMVDTPESISGQLAALSVSVDARFARVDQQFDQVDQRFEQVDQRFEQVDQRFEQVDQRFEQVDQRFEQVDQRFEQVNQQFNELRQQIAAEGEKTRRHFDIAVEQMKAERNLALDLSRATDERLLDWAGRTPWITRYSPRGWTITRTD